MVPDCDGKWFLSQLDYIPRIGLGIKERDLSIEEQNDNKTNLIISCLNLTKMLKSHGIILFNKFIGEDSNYRFKYIDVKLGCNINGKDFDSFSSALIYFLNENNFLSEKVIIDVKGEKFVFVIAQKKD